MSAKTTCCSKRNVLETVTPGACECRPLSIWANRATFARDAHSVTPLDDTHYAVRAACIRASRPSRARDISAIVDRLTDPRPTSRRRLGTPSMYGPSMRWKTHSSVFSRPIPTPSEGS